jgi:hypothetical protein
MRGLRRLVQETARLSECAAGVADSALGVALRADPTGRIGPDGSAPAGAAVRVISAHGRVWLERADDIVLDRFADQAARLLLDEATLVEVALSAGDAERARAIRLLRLDPAVPVHVLAVAADPEALATILGSFPPATRAASLRPVHAVLAGAVPPGLASTLPAGVRIGIGSAVPAVDAPESWRQARTALRFATLDTPYPAVVHFDQLGALAAIAARVRPSDIAGIADVAALDGLAADTLAVLTAFCATGSARRAAVEVDRHHSTVIAKLAHAETTLGFRFSTPAGRLRLELAVLLWHLRDTPDDIPS